MNGWMNGWIALEGKHMTAYVAKENKSFSHLEVEGDVSVKGKKGTLWGDAGVYDQNTQLVSVSGNVRIESEGRLLQGAYGIFNLKSDVHRLLTYEEARRFTAPHRAPLPPEEEFNRSKKRPSAVITIKDDASP